MVYFLECDCMIRPTIYIIKTVYNIVKILVPVGIVLFGMLELIKAVMSKDDAAIKKTQTSLINKVIAGVIIFFIFIVVDLSLALLEKNNVDVGDWLSCWQNPGTVDSSCTNKKNQGGKEVNGGIVNEGIEQKKEK